MFIMKMINLETKASRDANMDIDLHHEFEITCI
jgi:hypothetical protein